MSLFDHIVTVTLHKSSLYGFDIAGIECCCFLCIKVLFYFFLQ